MIITRRSLLIGGGALIASPALVRATSLMPLRGYDMDPWVVGFRSSRVKTIASAYNTMSPLTGHPRWPSRMTVHQKAAMLSGRYSSPDAGSTDDPPWVAMRVSELDEPIESAGLRMDDLR